MSIDNKYYFYINGTAVEVSKEIHDFLVKSDRQMKYAEQDRKQERITIDSENERVSVKPSICGYVRRRGYHGNLRRQAG